MKKKGKGKAATNLKGKKKIVDKGKCFHCNKDGHWKWNYPKYLVEKRAENENKGKYDLLVVQICLMQNDNSTWILDSRTTNHICSYFQETSS